MTAATFDVAAFRLAFPAFANVTAYPNIRLQGYWDMATQFVNNSTNCQLTLAALTLLLNLITAHIAQIFTLIAAGQTPGQINSATVDKITVSMTLAPQPNQWQWWLGLTPYGQQALALLQVKSVGGFYFGGLPEISAIRKVYGIF